MLHETSPNGDAELKCNFAAPAAVEGGQEEALWRQPPTSDIQ
jgi:hypothetical protein